MKVSRELLDERLSDLISRLDERKSIYNALEEKHNIPITITSDICSNRKDVSEVSNFIAFALLEEIKKKELDSYFTPEEIRVFSEQKYEKQEDVIIRFERMVQITDDQWIGATTAKQLMTYKETQLIKYNEHTQRTLQQVVHGENTYYKISLNRRAVREIKEALESGAYIPNDITLNVAIEPDEYDPKTGTIEFKEKKMLDILDGYHRYIAISQVMRDNPDFDYPMELRLVNFSEEKAKQFIYQNDQKTQMKKMNSSSLNQYNPANILVEELNTSPSSNLQNQISRNKGNIDFSFLSALVSHYYFPDRYKKYSLKERIDATNDLKQKFNAFTSADTSWLDHKYTERELQTIMYCFSRGITDPQKIRAALDSTSNIETQYFKLGARSIVRKRLLAYYSKIKELQGGG